MAKLLAMGLMMSIGILAMFATLCLGQTYGYTAGNAIDNTKGNYNTNNNNMNYNNNNNSDDDEDNIKDDDSCLGPFLPGLDIPAFFKINKCCYKVDKIVQSKTCDLGKDIATKTSDMTGLVTVQEICKALRGSVDVALLACQMGVLP